MPEISVIVCAYTQERWNDLVSVIEALKTQTVPPLEIIVVIDHNHDLWQQVQQTFTNVIVFENAQLRGLSGARNTGIQVAAGDVVAFIDEDAVPAPDWLECLSQGYTDPRVLGIGGAIEPNWGNERPVWFPVEFDWVVGCTYLGLPATTAPVRNLIGCNMSFRREVVDAVGGFRLGIGRVGTHPVGCEETELCIRIKQLYPTGKLLYTPQARVFHRVASTRRGWQYFRSRCYYEGRSKAIVTLLAGRQAGLSSEWTYTIQTLPLGVYRGLTAFIQGADQNGLARAWAIVVGLAITTTGYLMGRLFTSGEQLSKFEPVTSKFIEQTSEPERVTVQSIEQRVGSL